MGKVKNMEGNINNYKKMYDIIQDWDTGTTDTKSGHYIWHTFMGMGDAPYFGWTGDALKDENMIFDKVHISYMYFKKALAEALGINSTYSNKWDSWQKEIYDKINTDDIKTKNEIKNE